MVVGSVERFAIFEEAFLSDPLMGQITRAVPVGVIRDDSPAKAAAILQATDRTAALLENEKKAGQGGITPAFSVSPDMRKTLDAHHKLMLSLGFRGTPGIVVLQETGGIKSYGGMPRPAALPEVFGPL